MSSENLVTCLTVVPSNERYTEAFSEDTHRMGSVVDMKLGFSRALIYKSSRVPSTGAEAHF